MLLRKLFVVALICLCAIYLVELNRAADRVREDLLHSADYPACAAPPPFLFKHKQEGGAVARNRGTVA